MEQDRTADSTGDCDEYSSTVVRRYRSSRDPRDTCPDRPPDLNVVRVQVPICNTREDVMVNCAKIAAKIKGAKMGYPGLDLIIFPEYSTQVLPLVETTKMQMMVFFVTHKFGGAHFKSSCSKIGAFFFFFFTCTCAFNFYISACTISFIIHIHLPKWILFSL